MMGAVDAPERLRQERERLGLSQRAIAERLGINKNSQLAYEKGTSPITLDYLDRVAALGVDALYVASGSRSKAGMSVSSLLSAPIGALAHTMLGFGPEAQSADLRDRKLGYRGPPADGSDTVEVAEIDLRYGMGATFLDDAVDATPRSFSRAWLRNFTDSPPAELFWAKGQGNSMEPEIRDGDIVLIDRRQKSLLMSDLIWAFAYGDTGMIKWLRPMPDGSVKIHSSNQSVRPETAHDGEINIIGRVVAVVKRL